MPATAARFLRKGRPVKTNFVLVDFENVQPKNMGLLKGGPFKIKVFLGASQAKISLEMAQALQTFGEDAEYIQVVGSGKDALDFHIAYYMGKLAAENPGASFSIISKDTGFDPLIKHLKARQIDCKRSASVADIPQLKAAAPVVASAVERPAGVARKTGTKATAATTATETARSTARSTASATAAPKVRVPAKPAARVAPAVAAETGHVAAVLENLAKRKRALPGTVKTLRSTIQSLFKPALDDKELDAILLELGRRGKIVVSEKKVRYALD
jgi:hypothetical protein